MSGWTVAMIAGAVVVAAVAGMCMFVLRALRTTAETTQELARALERVQTNTDALAKLDAATSSIQGVSRDLDARLRARIDESDRRGRPASRPLP